MIISFEIPSIVEEYFPIVSLTLFVIIVAWVIQSRTVAKLSKELKVARSVVIVENVEKVEKVTAEVAVVKKVYSPITSKADALILRQNMIRRNHSYRMEEELPKKSSSEYTRRGQLWSKHASWNLPKAPRSHRTMFRYPVQGLEHVTVSFNLLLLKGNYVDDICCCYCVIFVNILLTITAVIVIRFLYCCSYNQLCITYRLVPLPPTICSQLLMHPCTTLILHVKAL